jgi:hypothetical protein
MNKDLGSKVEELIFTAITYATIALWVGVVLVGIILALQ